MYILLRENVVQEIIPDENPIFPGIPIEERYTADFVSQLIHVEDDVQVSQNDVYDSETGTFTAPAKPEPTPAPDDEFVSQSELNNAYVEGVQMA